MKPASPSRLARIVEVKRGLFGGERRFECELVHRSPSLVLVCFRVEEAGWGLPETPLDSYGCFWKRRPYVCYHMVRPADGTPVVTRFDVVRNVELVADEVRYTDLLLDLRVEGGVLRWEDEDEVQAAAASGALSEADRSRIAHTRALLDRRHALVTTEVRRLLRALGRLPPQPPE